jgi:HEAT repeat protein
MMKIFFMTFSLILSNALFPVCRNAFCQQSTHKIQPLQKDHQTTASPITEKEQKIVEELTEDALMTPNSFRSEAAALKYLKILLKGDHNSFRYFKEYETEDKKETEYAEAINSALQRLEPMNKDSFDVIVKVLKTKREYPRAVSEAASVIKYANNKSVMPILVELTKHPDSSTRCEAANSLFELGDADTALPVFKELIDKEASTEAIKHLFTWRKGEVVKLKDERGYSILDNALNNSKALVRVEAARLLYKVNRLPKKSAKIIAIETLSSFKPMKSYGVQYDYTNSVKMTSAPGSGIKDLEKANREWNIDRRAYRSAIFLLRDLKEKDSISALQKFAKRSDDTSLSEEASKAIDYINGK